MWWRSNDQQARQHDYSEASVTAARRTNARWIDIGRVEIQHGTVSQLPFANETFDLVTAVETHLFWPDPPEDMREIFRVLKRGGGLLIVSEIYKGGKHVEGFRQKILEKHIAARMNLLTADEHASFSPTPVFPAFRFLKSTVKVGSAAPEKSRN